jgi:mRNA interferase RelE/StbE
MASSPKWKIEFDPAAQKELDSLDKPIARRISKFLYERVAKLDDPHWIGERLTCSLENNRLVVLVLRIGHRKEVYSR